MKAYTIGCKIRIQSHQRIGMLRRYHIPKSTIGVIIDHGFGFIKTEEVKELFFRRNELEGVEFSNLKAVQKVEFEVGQDRKQRPQTVKVRITETQTLEPHPSPSS